MEKRYSERSRFAKGGKKYGKHADAKRAVRRNAQ